ncbi:MAG: hypothetical protein ORN53_04285 [Crocinitomicaceae bacterium]|nr:hypothetical protein [Crocinitomicaceae bacterium]
MLKRPIFLSLSILFTLSSFFMEKTTEFNPTGTYEYDNGDNGNGIVKVKNISKDKFNVSIFVVGGPPSHNMGEFMEELKIKNGIANYKSCDCQIKFIFNSKAVKVIQSGFDCGFGAGIAVNGYYKKTSSKVPNMVDPY